MQGTSAMDVYALSASHKLAQQPHCPEATHVPSLLQPVSHCLASPACTAPSDTSARHQLAPPSGAPPARYGTSIKKPSATSRHLQSRIKSLNLYSNSLASDCDSDWHQGLPPQADSYFGDASDHSISVPDTLRMYETGYGSSESGQQMTEVDSAPQLNVLQALLDSGTSSGAAKVKILPEHRRQSNGLPRGGAGSCGKHSRLA